MPDRFSRREFLSLWPGLLPFETKDSKIKKALSSPEFLRSFIAAQFDPKEYAYPVAEALMRNDCGQAVLATLVRIYAYLLTSERSNFLISDVVDSQKLPGQMGDYAMYKAIDSIGSSTGLFKPVAIIPFEEQSKVIAKEWRGIMQFAEEKIFRKNGLLQVRALKYSNDKNLQTHIFLITGNGLIIDTRYPDPRENPQGRVLEGVSLDTYCEQFYGETGLVFAQGIIPLAQNPRSSLTKRI